MTSGAKPSAPDFVRTLQTDLAAGDLDDLLAVTADLDVGLVACIAGATDAVGRFLEHPVRRAERLVHLNCLTPVQVCHHLRREAARAWSRRTRPRQRPHAHAAGERRAIRHRRLARHGTRPGRARLGLDHLADGPRYVVGDDNRVAFDAPRGLPARDAVETMRAGVRAQYGWD